MTTTTTTVRTAETPANFETKAWLFMRYSGILLIPLVWIHVLIKDVLVGVHAITLDYVIEIWAMWGWKVYDILLLAFTFAHGVNGLRQVGMDFFHTPKARKNMSRLLLVLWVVVSALGAVAIFAGARPEM